MEYDVLEEAKHATDNLEKNAWSNHKEQYISTASIVEDFNDKIDVLELRQQQATTQEEKDAIQDELTMIIDDILSINDEFGSSLITVDNTIPLANQDDLFKINLDALQ